MRRTRQFLCVWPLIVPGLVLPAFALDPVAFLVPIDCDNNDFGRAVAISGDYIAVGARRDPCNNGNSFGAVYVFRRLGPEWRQVTKLTAPDPQWEDQLGFSVDMEGDVIVAGAPRRHVNHLPDSGPGAVYVFRRDDQGTPDDPWDDTWPFEAKLTAPNPQLGQLLGWSVALSGYVVVAGKPGHNGTAEVYRFDEGSWLHEATLADSQYHIGDSIDIYGDGVVAGAWGYSPGLVLYFNHKNGTWLREQVLAPDENDGVGFFGYSVAIDEEAIVVGAPSTNGSSIDEGAGYLFSHNAIGMWVEQTIFTAPISSRYDELGKSVAIDDGLIIVGRMQDPWAFLFKRENGVWIFQDELYSRAGADWGFSIAMQGNHAVVNFAVYAIRNKKTLEDFAAFQSCLGSDDSLCTKFGAGVGIVTLRDFEKFMGTFAGP